MRFLHHRMFEGFEIAPKESKFSLEKTVVVAMEDIGISMT